MNGKERDQLAGFSIRLGNIEKAVETIKTNDLPHLHHAVSKTTGKLSILIPLTIGTLLAVLSMIAVFAVTLVQG